MSRLVIIGYPIAHSLSPAIYNATLPVMGIDAHYEAWPTLPEDVPAAIERLRREDMLGMNVTVPHKEAVIPLLDQVDALAAGIGAVNCIARRDGRLIGYNTDCYGFVRSLREAGCEPEGITALILGAGGSARAVGYGLLQSGTSHLLIAGRTLHRVQELADQLHPAFPGADVRCLGWDEEALGAACAEVRLVVNCTPLGMLHSEQEHDSPLPAHLLRSDMYVYDLVYNPPLTPLLREAKTAGAIGIGGLEMLVYQAAESVRHWTGRDAPLDIMREAARTALAGAT